MTPVGALLREVIRKEGPIPFSRFMREALYHPGLGYYRRQRAPWGVQGDYYTASQLQPVFGILVAQAIASLIGTLESPGAAQVVEIGAGRGDMAEALGRFRYQAVEVGQAWPEQISGVIFANELFDALPVDVACYAGGRYRDVDVSYDEESARFVWRRQQHVTPAHEAYLRRFGAPQQEGFVAEVHEEAILMLRRMAHMLAEGYVVIVDYGYTRREWIRFPLGTLMSYRRHQALTDVLAQPGEQDITAHVPFHVLEETARACGLEVARQESLALFLLAAGEQDQFAAALAAEDKSAARARRLQLKSLLYGMGETFRVLLLRKRGAK